jgi:hypothetical protein
MAKMLNVFAGNNTNRISRFCQEEIGFGDGYTGDSKGDSDNHYTSPTNKALREDGAGCGSGGSDGNGYSEQDYQPHGGNPLTVALLLIHHGTIHRQ